MAQEAEHPKAGPESAVTPGGEAIAYTLSPERSTCSPLPVDLREREATELETYAGGNPETETIRSSVARPENGWFSPLKRFWRRQISLAVPHVACRDHLGTFKSIRHAYMADTFIANERTYLAWFRTAASFSILGIIIAQLFRLQHSVNPSTVLGFYISGVPLACVCQGVALITTLIAAHRFWRLQNVMAQGNITTGGWEIGILLVLTGLVSRSSRLPRCELADIIQASAVDLLAHSCY